MSERVDAAERMLDLVIALSHTRHRMTKAQIRATVRGYESESTEAFERMFERDKDALRQLGIPLVTLTDAVHEDEIGYRIDTAAYELAPIDLSPAQMGVLSLAAEVWQDSGFGASARRGLTKLRAVADTSAPADAGVTLRVRGPDPVIGDLLDAITTRTPVTFRYRAAYSGQTAVRTVQPWRIHARDRGWYLLAQDVDRGAARSFRTSRILGAVKAAGTPASYEIPDVVPARGSTHQSTVRLAIRPERASALRARGDVVGTTPDGVDATSGARRDVVEFSVADVEQCAEEIAGYGEAVLVLDPPDLKDSVLRRLRAIARLAPE